MEKVEKRVLNIYGSKMWHDTALMVSSREALEELKVVIDRALAEGRGSMDCVASDGEIYGLEIQVKETEDTEWENMELPYTHEIATWEEKEIMKDDLLARGDK